MFHKLKKYVLSHPLKKEHHTELMEAVSKVYYLKHFNYMDDDLIERTKEEIPSIPDNIIVIAINIVKMLMFKPEYLTKEIQDEINLWDNAED